MTEYTMSQRKNGVCQCKIQVLFISGSFFVSVSDKNLSVSISGDVDEARALSKPPDDSQGAYDAFDAHHRANGLST